MLECLNKYLMYLFTFVYLFCFIVLLNLEYTIMNVWPKKLSVFVYLCVPFLFYCLVKFRVHHNEYMTKKKLSVTCYPWCILWNGIADEHCLFSRIQFSHVLSIHCLWLITHGWASMSCCCAVRKKVMWTKSFKQVGVVFSWSRGRD